MAIAAALAGGDVAHGAALLAQDQDERPGAPAAVAAGLPGMLIDDQLQPKPVRVISLDAQRLTFVDELGRERRVPLARVVALVLDARPQPRPELPGPLPGLLRLSDGQTFPGDVRPGPAEPDTLSWEHPTLGSMRFKLDVVADVRRPGPGRVVSVGPDQADDVLIAGNGDRLSGFVVAVGDPTIIDTNEGQASLELDRVLALRFAGGTQPAEGLRVWLADGTVAAAQSLDIEPQGRVTLALADGPSGSVDASSLRAVVFDAARLEPLSEREAASFAPAEGRRWTAGPRVSVAEAGPSGEAAVVPLGARDIDLPGPMDVRWDLPKTAKRFTASAALDVRAQPWGDCELLAVVDGKESFRGRLVAGGAPVGISLDLEGARSLELRVLPGKFGPIQDRVILSSALLLVGEPSPSRRETGER